MELRHVRSFIAVAEELNFGRAARRLGLSQPPVSKQIQALEADLGIALFDRGRGGVRLTKGGEAALQEAYRLIEQSDRMKQVARQAEAGESGRLTIAYLPSAMREVLPRLLEIFRADRPEAEISLKEFSTVEAVQALQDRCIDIALIRLAHSVEPLRSLSLQHTERCLVALPNGHPLARQSLIRLKDLGGETFVVFVPAGREFPPYSKAILESCEKAGVQVHCKHEVLSVASMLKVVASGMGVGLVPDPSQDLSTPGVTFVPLAETIPVIDMSLVWNGNAPSRLVEHFVAVARTLATRSNPASV